MSEPTSPKPTALPVVPENIPEELRNWPQWIVWRYEWDPEKKDKLTGQPGKWDKPPRQARTGALASSTDRQTWDSFETALGAYRTGGWDGIGFSPSADDPFVFVDLDSCFNGTGISERHWRGVIVPMNTYTEWSPSGTGIRIIARGELPDGKGHKHTLKKAEIYDRGHYLTITGQRITSLPAAIEDRQSKILDLYKALDPSIKSPPTAATDKTKSPPTTSTDKEVLGRCRRARNKTKFIALYDEGDLTEYNGDDSAADQALCCLIARWTSNPEQIDRLFRQSKLMREKWGRQDYRNSTIEKAIALVAETRARAAAQFFDADLGFVSKRMGEFLNDEARLLVGADGRLYRYRHGVYRPDGLSWAASRTRELLGEAFKRKHWVEVREWLLADEPGIGLNAQADWLNLPNGRLNWRSGELEAHSEEFLDIIRIPVPWQPGAVCPRFDQFLTETLPEDAIDFVLELLGYLVVPLVRYQKAMMLLGPTGTGKGTLLHVIRQLCGPENVTAQPLHAFAEDRFATSSLFGKLANVCGDLDAHQVRRSDVFKQVTGEDAIQAQFKYGHSFSFVPFSRLIFSANEAPASADVSDAYFARWLIVPMTTRFRDTEREDTRLRERLVEELPGILQLAVAGLRALEERGRFRVPQSIIEAAREFRLRADTVSAFVAERITFGDGWCTRSQLREAYEEWCRQNGLMSATAHTFYDRLRDDYPVTEVVREGIRGFKGLWLLRA